MNHQKGFLQKKLFSLHFLFGDNTFYGQNMNMYFMSFRSFGSFKGQKWLKGPKKLNKEPNDEKIAPIGVGYLVATQSGKTVE